jgi:hypothetical protein
MHGVGQKSTDKRRPIMNKAGSQKRRTEMKPNTIITRGGSRSLGRRHQEPFFGKRHIALAVGLIALLAAPSQSEGSDEPYHVIFPVHTRVIAGNGLDSCNQYSVEVNGKSYHCQDGPLTGFNIVSFKRAPGMDAAGWPTLDLYEYKTIRIDGGGDRLLKPVADYLDTLLDDSKSPEKLLIIVSTLGRVGGPLWDIAPELEKFGATKEFESIDNPDFTFSFIPSKQVKSSVRSCCGNCSKSARVSSRHRSTSPSIRSTQGSGLRLSFELWTGNFSRTFSCFSVCSSGL